MLFESELQTADNDYDIFHHFQPIYCLANGKEAGLEALLRSKEASPDILFEKAKQAHFVYQLDTNSILKAFFTWVEAGGLKHGGLLFLNVLPSTLVHPNFPIFINQLLQEFKVPKQRIVLELNEADQTLSIYFSKMLKKRIAFLKSNGFLIAIDDLGKGWASLATLIDIDPHFAKLDLYFSANLSISKKKQMMIEAVIQYCRGNDIQLVLEGIENEVDLEMAKSLGVDFGQGYLLGRPKLLEPLKEKKS